MEDALPAFLPDLQHKFSQKGASGTFPKRNATFSLWSSFERLLSLSPAVHAACLTGTAHTPEKQRPNYSFSPQNLLNYKLH